MADEIRIPVTIELISQEAKSDSSNKERADVKTNKANSNDLDLSSIVNMNMLMGTARKLMAASGNTQGASTLRVGMKYGTMAKSTMEGFSKGGKSMALAVVTIAAEVLEQVIKADVKAKENRQKSNEALYNQVLRGDLWLGSTHELAYDKYGKLTYYKK